MEEVGRAGEGQEEDPRPHRSHPHPKGEWPEGVGVIRAYHTRRVAPLMMRACTLYAMAPKVSFDGTTLAEGALPNFEITQRIKEVMEPLQDDTGAALNFIYPVSGHPPMRPEPGYVIFVSFTSFCHLFN